MSRFERYEQRVLRSAVETPMWGEFERSTMKSNISTQHNTCKFIIAICAYRSLFKRYSKTKRIVKHETLQNIEYHIILYSNLVSTVTIQALAHLITTLCRALVKCIQQLIAKQLASTIHFVCESHNETMTKSFSTKRTEQADTGQCHWK